MTCPALHHEADLLESPHVLERVGGDGDQVGVMPCGDPADVVGAAEQFGGVGGG